MTVDQISAVASVAFDDYATLDELYRSRLTRYLRRCYRGDVDVDVEEAVQETFCRAYERFSQLDAARDPWPWLVVVARNVINDSKRHQARAKAQLAGATPLTVTAERSPLESMIAREDAMALGDLIAQLPASQRMVFKLRLVDQWSYADIAAFTDTTENCVRQQLHRARCFVAARWRGREGRSAGLLVLPGLGHLRNALRRMMAPQVLQPLTGVIVAGTLALGVFSAGQLTAPPSGASTLSEAPTVALAQHPASSTVAPALHAAAAVTTDGHAAARPPLAETPATTSGPELTTDLSDPPLAPGSHHEISAGLPVGDRVAVVKVKDDNSESGGLACEVLQICKR